MNSQKKLGELNSKVDELHRKLQTSEKHVALLRKEKNRLHDDLQAAFLSSNTQSEVFANRANKDDTRVKEGKSSSPYRASEADPARKFESKTTSPIRKETTHKPTSTINVSKSGEKLHDSRAERDVETSNESTNPYDEIKLLKERKGFVNSFFYESAAETVAILRNKLKKLRAEYNKLQAENQRLQQKMKTKQLQERGKRNMKRGKEDKSQAEQETTEETEEDNV